MTNFGPKQEPNNVTDARLSGGRTARNLEGERRVVTILFCDVAGSTALAEQLDPEDWAEMMGEAFDLLTLPVERYGGKLARLMGDAILAFFGAPISHEDDPQRAVLAGLDILAEILPFQKQVQKTYGFEFNVRIGINTGPVVVGEIGSQHAMEYTAMGDAVNLAARMQQTAQPGTLQISGDTYKWVAPLFDCEALGEIQVKGKSEAVSTYRVLGKKAHPGSLRGISGLRAPLVGRSQELATLLQQLENLRLGRGQIISLIGEAGLGKSRIIEEVHNAWEAMVLPPNSWLECHGVSYDTEQPYSLFRQQLRITCGVTEKDSPEAARQKILQTFMGLQATSDQIPEEKAKTYRAIEVLLAIPQRSDGPRLTAEAVKRELFETVESIYRKSATLSPLVVVFDDLHWSDPASLELLLHLFPLVETLPLLLLCAYRPYRQHPGWQVKQTAETNFPHRYTEIVLQPLSDQDSGALVDNLLKISDLPEELRRTLLRKTEGNPFFVEEVIRSLIDQGILERDASGMPWQAASQEDLIHIPDNLQALLVARIDHLDSESRHILQLASVIGRTFYYRLLEKITQPKPDLEKHLNTLQRMELIQEIRRLPELEYSFRHELTRDAAYQAILHRNLRRFHRQVGEAFEALFPERLEEEAGRLAYHFDQADEGESALKYYLIAADRAARIYANTEAIMQYRHALAIARRRWEAGQLPPEEFIGVYVRLGRTLEVSGLYDEALSNYQEMENLGQATGNQTLELAALIPQATIYSVPTMKQDVHLGRGLAEHSLALATQLSDHNAEARAYWNLMLLDVFGTHDYEKAVDYGKQAIVIARRFQLTEVLAFALQDIARPYINIGQSQAAMAAIQEAQLLWRELGNQPMLADSLSTLAQGMYMLGMYDPAVQHAREALQISQTTGNLWGQAYSYFALAPIYFEQGNFEEGIHAVKEAMFLGKQANFKAPQYSGPIFLTWVYAMLGDMQSSLGWYHQFLELSPEEDLPTLYPSIFKAYELMLYRKEKEAWELISSIWEQIINVNYDFYFGPLIVDMAFKVTLANHQFEAAIQVAEIAIAGMKTSGMHLFLPDILFAKGQALKGLGKQAEAYASLEQARRDATQKGSRRSLWPVLAALAGIEEERGKLAEAQELRQEARQVVDYIAAHIAPPELRASFLSLPEVRQIWGND